MKLVTAEEYDLIVTQYIEQYLEMSEHEARQAIREEWNEQMETLLTIFLFMESYQPSRGLSGFMQKARRDGNSDYIVRFSGGKLL